METPLAEIRNLPQLKGRTVRLRGWVWNRRGSGRIRFAQLRDGTGFAQLVAGEQDLDAESFELLKRLSQESLVEAEGTYLAWVDCRALGFDDEGLKRFILDEAKLWLDQGDIFGKPGSGFIRINIATQRAYLQRALEQLANAVALHCR